MTIGIEAVALSAERWHPGVSLRRRWLRSRWAGRVAALAAACLAWQAASGWLGSGTVPAPGSVLGELVAEIRTDVFWTAVGSTLSSTLLGMLVVTAVGVPLGVLLGASRPALASTRFLVDFFRTIPPVTLLPLGLLLFGPTLEMKLLVVVFGAFWPVLLHSIYAVRDIGAGHRAVVDVFEVPRAVAWWGVYLPSMVPMILIGVRISLTVALLGSIASEILGGAPGLGAEMVQAQVVNDVSRTYAYVVATACLGVGLNLAMNHLPSPRVERQPSGDML
jgi:ABC-type nitrate/sulfonate/bicarbonate transport system permease component